MGLILRKFKHPGKADKTSLMMNKTSLMMTNVGILLEKLIKFTKGNRDPFRSFSIEEVKKATNNFNVQNVIEAYSLYHEVYKGFLHESPVFFIRYRDDSPKAEKYCFRNSFLALQLCPGKSLKLIGCCLETQTPILVFQSVNYCSLADRIYLDVGRPDFEPLLWTHRLKIAREIANVVAYFHVVFRFPLVLRNIHPSTIFFNEEHKVKLLDFSGCKSVPKDKTYKTTETVPVVVGHPGYLAPEYVTSGYCNQKGDVFSFGGLLLEFLTGQRVCDRFSSATDEKYCFLLDHVLQHMENNRLKDIVDPIIFRDGLSDEKEQQLQSFVDLAIKCSSESPENRPTMVDAAKQLRQLYLSCNSC